MADTLCSVGLDVGTTSTQLIVSRLTVENRASGFAVPEMEITGRDILYRSNVHFTPLVGENLVDGDAIRALVLSEYEKAGLSRDTVDTGAVIITGETSRKENARAVMTALSELSGEFVVATAGPDLESVLAARGAGAVEHSAKTGKTVLHMDIGGGTSNLALIEDGRIVKTGCLNVGGRLIKRNEAGVITYVSPVLEGLTPLQVGDTPTAQELGKVTGLLVQALEMAAGKRPPTELLAKLMTRETTTPWNVPEGDILFSFSGGVADCIDTIHPDLTFGDIGPALGQAIKGSRLIPYILGSETIRATVIGAGCHSARLSGSTVFYKNISLPLQNLPVAAFTEAEQDRLDLPDLIAGRIDTKDSQMVVLALPGYRSPNYHQITALAEKIRLGMQGRPVLVCLEWDMAKALGHALCLHLPPGTPCLCIDRVRLSEDSFLDIGQPVGPALPVVVKTLILSK
ncbi:MAG: ethanolamine ammonia-lyase reactivating factor EutA [Oscillospiraceae bacterium]|nr:ethanolamine ammonia-lyase reactivating factor EutA [Oscillospiraceae bacterium]